MSRYKVYIKPYETAGIYQTDFIDVSNDVISIDQISQSLDNSTYDIGVFKTSGLKIKFRNDHGRFSEADSYKSLFRYSRQDSIVKVTWSIQDDPIRAGFFTLNPFPIGGEITIFEGLLYDISGVSSVEDQFIDFRLAGYDSLLDRVIVPYSSITNGDTFSEVIYKMLNQPEITQYVTVDQANIVCAVNETIDDKTSLENETLRDVLTGGSLLLAASSTLYIENNIVYVKNRDATADVQYNFFGQASPVGIENIISVKEYRDGTNKIFNYVAWGNTADVRVTADSIAKYGSRKISLSTSLIEDASTTKITNILGEIRDDFSVPKRELKLETPINYQTIALFLKDKVNIDYPTIYISADGKPLPRWGSINWDDFSWPIGQFSLVISSTDSFKIMSKKINPKNDTITFDLREV